MIKHRNNARKSLLSDMNVVPYIDVMLVLLVIFMITAPMLTQGVHVDLPKAEARTLSNSENAPIILSIDRDGRFYLNQSPRPNTPISSSELVAKVSTLLQAAEAQHHPKAVYVKGDQAVDYGHIIEGMSLLQKAGAPSVGMITTPRD